MGFIKYIFILSLFSPAIGFSAESVNLCSSSFISAEQLRRNLNAEIRLEQDLQAIRNSPQEPRLIEQGFKPSYYAGVDQAREFDRLHEYLQEIQADPKSTHIPYFADQVEKTISDFERGLRKQNVTGDKYKIKDPKFLEKRLKILEDFKKEARRRVENQDVTYDWWIKFNTKLSLLASPEALQHIPESRYTSPVERVKMGIEIEYNKKLAQAINKVMNSYPETEKRSQSFQNLKKKFENLNLEELFSGEDYTSQELESMLSELESKLDSMDNKKGAIQIEMMKEDDWYNIDVLQIKEGIEEIMSNGIQTPMYDTKINEVVFTDLMSKEFPEKVLFFTTDELGIMAFNTLGENAHFVSLSADLEKMVDGNGMNSLEYLLHDVSHANVSSSAGVELPKEIFDRVNNISNKSDREKVNLAIFMYRHEAGNLGNNHSQSALEDMMFGFLRLDRWFNPKDLQGLLPDSVDVKDRSEVKSFLRETATLFGKILSDLE